MEPTRYTLFIPEKGEESSLFSFTGNRTLSFGLCVMRSAGITVSVSFTAFLFAGTFYLFHHGLQKILPFSDLVIGGLVYAFRAGKGLVEPTAMGKNHTEWDSYC
ncbi:hypothetical protein MR626_02110 [bacterium]|nr:hypothetical protein [bacterium]